MRNTWGMSLAVCLALTAGSRVRADDQADMKALLGKAIKAVGGEKKIAKNKAVTWNFKGKIFVIGNGAPYTAEWLVQAPGQAKATITVEINCASVTIVKVLNKTKGWEKVADKTIDMNKSQLAEFKDQIYFFWLTTLVPLKDKAFKLTLLDEAKVDGKPAVGVKVTHADYPEVKLYFDKKTHLLVKSQWQSRAAEQKFKEVTAEMHYSKYQEIEGAQVPTRVVLNRDGELFVEADLSDVKTVSKHEPGTFDKP